MSIRQGLARKGAALLCFALLAALIAYPPPTSAEAFDDTLNRIQDRERLIIGHRTDARPFSFVGPDGVVKGYSIELCLRIAGSVREALGLARLEVDYVPVDPTNHVQKLQDGTVDIVCGATTHTISRRKHASFTLITYITTSEMLVHEASSVRSVEALAGKRAGVREGTTSEKGIRETFREHDIRAEVVTFDDHEDGIDALQRQEIDAYVGDRVLLTELSQEEGEDAPLLLINRVYSFEPYALMLPKHAEDLRLIADRTLAYLHATGFTQELFRHWFGDFHVGTQQHLLQALFQLQAIPE